MEAYENVYKRQLNNNIPLFLKEIFKAYNFLRKLNKRHERIAYRPTDTTRVTATLNICGERTPLM